MDWNFRFICVIDGFVFLEAETDEAYELWMVNKESSQMRMVCGFQHSLDEEEVQEFWDSQYFWGYIHDETFTD